MEALQGQPTERKGKLTKVERNKQLCKAIVEYRWDDVESMINEDKGVITEAIDSDGNMILHIVVEMGSNYFVSEMLSKIEDVKLPKMKNKYGSTTLHIAAIVGNKEAAKLLIKKNKVLLDATDFKGETPLHKAFENMHLSTIEYLLKVANDDGKPKLEVDVKKGINVLVNAISAKQYDLTKELIKRYPEFVVEDDDVLMAIAKTFPSGLDYLETFIYPIPNYNYKKIVHRAKGLFYLLKGLYINLMGLTHDIPNNMIWSILRPVAIIIGMVPLGGLTWILNLILLVIQMVYFPLFMFYFSLWKVLKTILEPIEHIEKKFKEPKEAKEVLKLVCDEIEKLGCPDIDHPRLYARPVLEAARQDAYEVVDEILMRCPKAIRYKR
ncbi:uncharacterized protein LOC111889297 [Lactuca sativa]|uniref:uncharacterized protein LOC111889297 n=1 Tax=Lactuca sativa TaxID=4236 RepID=UPI000CD9A4B2|nr:uncharacterized protein LOC111889297 [Lactuca sativa]